MQPLATQHPSLDNIPAFLGAVAGALERMHAEQRAHGAIVEGAFRNWLAQTGDMFDEEAFRASADLAKPFSEDAALEDVRAFVVWSIRLIEGERSAPDQPFQPDLHFGKGWPEAFLLKLAEIHGAAAIGATMTEINRALHSDVSSAEEALHEAAHEAEPAASIPQETSPAPAEPTPTAQPPQPQISISLRNATVGKPYQVEPGAVAKAIAEKRGDNPEHAHISHLQLPEDCGLEFDKGTGAVSGTPTRAFDGTLRLDYVPRDHQASIPFTVKFLINPDPASLWKDLPAPTDAPYPKPDTVHSATQEGPFRIVAASRRGRSHANKGEFRDDDYAIGFAAETGWLIVAVADGAGSAKYARRGSQVACETAKARLAAVLNSPEHNLAESLYQTHQDWNHPEVQSALRRILYEAALSAHHKLREEAAQPAEALPEPPTLRNYDTTLILLVMKETAAGRVAATFAIGDGGAGLLPTSGEGFPLTRPEGGEHAGQTTFLTLPSSLKDDEESLASHFHCAVVPTFTGALVMTDGITDPKFPSDSAFSDPAQWAALWAELQPVLTSSEALLEWMNFFSPGNHDDRTLVAVLPAPSVADPS